MKMNNKSKGCYCRNLNADYMYFGEAVHSHYKCCSIVQNYKIMLLKMLQNFECN